MQANAMQSFYISKLTRFMMDLLECNIYIWSRWESFWIRTNIQALDQSRPKAVGPSIILFKILSIS